MFGRFLYHFAEVTWHVRTVILALLALIVIAAVENMPIGDALYFAFITGLTVGFGDLVPHTGIGRLVAVLIGVVGMLFTGLVVAGAVHAVGESWAERHKRQGSKGVATTMAPAFSFSSNRCVSAPLREIFFEENTRAEAQGMTERT